MQNLRLFFLGPLWLIAFVLFGQSTPRKPTTLEPGNNGFVSSPASIKEQKRPRGYRVLARQRNQAKKTPTRHTAQYEFYERVERAAKLRQKMLLEQARYKRSDFGHKRKPRKRPPHKMRYCNECGIRH